MEHPLISIIIPAYNCASYLAETIKSVQQQTYPHFEIIIINDGSTDATLEVAEELAQTDSRIRVLSHTNSKQGKTRNAGAAVAKGQYIAFLDGDDIWVPHKLELQLAALEAKQVDLVFSDGFICLNNDISSRDHTFQITQKTYDRNDLELFYHQNQVPTSTVLCTKAAFDKSGGFDEELEVQNCEDYLLWVRMLDKGCRFYGLDENLILYRVHPTSSTATRVNQLRPLSFALMRMNTQSAIRLTRLKQALRDLLTELNSQQLPLQQAEALLKEYFSRFEGKGTQLAFSLALHMPVKLRLALIWRLI